MTTAEELGLDPDVVASACQDVYDRLVEVAEARHEKPAIVEALASLAAAWGLEDGRGCDGCDRVMVEDLLSAAGLTYAHAVDGNGDPDVSICPFCRLETWGDRP